MAVSPISQTKIALIKIIRNTTKADAMAPNVAAVYKIPRQNFTSRFSGCIKKTAPLCPETTETIILVSWLNDDEFN